MRAVAELSVHSMDEHSQRGAVAAAKRILERHRITARTHAMATEIEGEIDEVLAAVGELHRELHEAGTQRVFTTVSIETRTDKPVSLDEREAKGGNTAMPAG